MNTGATAVPTHCPHCGDSHLDYKSKAALWECQSCEERFPGAVPDSLSRRLMTGRAARPKSIFLSYGHDENKELVELFKQDLEKRGHEVWFDAKDIGTWDDWKGKITRGIDASQLAIAFMSKHSIRDPGVCRNEIAIAMNRFGTVYPILLEDGIEKDIPVTISHLQWPDLSQWKGIRDGNVPDTDWNRWYEEKLLNLVEKLEGDATRFAEETRVLRQTLQPSSFESKITQHVPGFIGREWIFDAYTQWLDHQPESRLFWIKAGPGIGKSAIAANLAHRQRGAIVASWFCDAKSSELKDPNNALKSIAFQLALRWEDYRVRLLRKLGLHAGTTDETCDEIRKELEKKNTHDLFLFLLAEPMANLIWREHKLVVVIDALDEATDEQGNNRITELISNELSSLPEWMGFVVTSRPEADIVNRLQGFKPFEINAQDPRNLADLRSWHKQHLGRQPELSKLPDAEQGRIEDLLIERSGGMILYLKVVEEGFREGSLTVAKLEQLESGLPGLYRRYYDSFQQRFGSDYETSVKPLLRLLLAAGGPLPEDLACAALGWNSEQFLACCNRLGSYMLETGTGHELFHKTLSEWLSGKSSGTFHLDHLLGRQMLADVLFKEIASRESYQARWRKPIQEWLPIWLPHLSQYEEPFSLIELGSILKGWANYSQALSLFERALVIRKGTLPAGHPDIATSLNNLANLLETIARYDVAEQLLREALAIRKAALPANHLDIAKSLNSLAVLLYNTSRHDEAESLYREALAIRKAALPSGHPDIAMILNNLANLFWTIGRYDEAEPLFREALGIQKAALPTGDPDIATSLNNLACLLSTINRHDEAAPLFLDALALQKAALPEGHPDIALSLNNLARLRQNTGRHDEAVSLYQEALAIQKTALPEGHPETTQSLNNLADLLQATGRYDEAVPLCRENLAFQKAVLTEGHPDIVKSLSNLARLLQVTGRLDEAESLCREALAILKSTLPSGHPAIAWCLNNLAGLLYNNGRQDEAEPFLREALAIRKTALPTGHPDIAQILNNLANLLQANGRHNEAEPLFREALVIWKAAYPAGHPDIVGCLSNLAKLLKTTGRHEEAEALFLEALKFRRKVQ